MVKEELLMLHVVLQFVCHRWNKQKQQHDSDSSHKSRQSTEYFSKNFKLMFRCLFSTRIVTYWLFLVAEALFYSEENIERIGLSIIAHERNNIFETTGKPSFKHSTDDLIWPSLLFHLRKYSILIHSFIRVHFIAPFRFPIRNISSIEVNLINIILKGCTFSL